MKSIAVVFIAIFVALYSGKIYSQHEYQNLLGFGVSIDPARIGHVTYYSYGEVAPIVQQINNNSPILFYVPFNVTDSFRIEPVFGINSMNSKNTSTNLSTLSSDYNSYTNTYDATATTIGISAYYLSSLSKSFAIYIGPRLDYAFLTINNEYKNEQRYGGVYSSSTNTTVTKETDMIAGLAFGAEYYPIKHFSFGAEVNFNYTSYGNPNITNTTNPPPQTPPTMTTANNTTQYSYNTDGMFYVRWYFLSINK